MRTINQILDLPMEDNDASAKNIREYFEKLLLTLWEEEESFSGKRPFGDSGWQEHLFISLVKHGEVEGTLNEYGYLD